MKNSKILSLALPAALLAADAALAQATVAMPQFGSPVLLKAGDALLGQDRLYPSPVYQDMNGDGRADLVIGDLRGHMTVALRDANGATFGAESKLQGADGAIVDLHNW